MAKWTMADIKKTGLTIKIPGKEKHIELSENGPVNVSGPGYSSNVPREKTKNQKYHNRKTNGFDSKKEADFYKGLKFKEKAGLVTGICCQVTFQLSACKYIADFVCFDLVSGAWQVYDVKGVKTGLYILKAKMMLRELKIKIIEV